MENNLISSSIDRTLENILDNPTKNIGKTLGDIWFLVFGGISQKAEKRKLEYSCSLHLFKESLEKEINKIPDNNKTCPDIQIVANTLEASKYCIEKKELRDMFIKLIVSSIDVTKSQYIHPSFAELIRNMNSDEALLIKYMCNKLRELDNRFPVVDVRWVANSELNGVSRGFEIFRKVNKDQIESVYYDKPFAEIDLGRSIYRNTTLLGVNAGCKNPYAISGYLENLMRLRIIELSDKKVVQDRGVYLNIVESEYMNNLLFNNDIVSFDDELFYAFDFKYVFFTDYGMRFVEACCD